VIRCVRSFVMKPQNRLSMLIERLQSVWAVQRTESLLGGSS
jgi:hypothetical protein